MFKDIWPALPEDVSRLFISHSRKLEFKRGEVVYRMGDAPKGLYLVEGGLIGLTIIGQQSGKEHLMRFFKAGQFFGHRSLFSKESYHGNATALELTKILLIPKDTVIDSLERHPVLLKEIVWTLAQELRRSELQHVMILENQILSRTAQALVYLKELHPEHSWTRQEIANFCASTVSTIIKAMAELEEMGLISQVGRSITILNKEALIAMEQNN